MCQPHKRLFIVKKTVFPKVRVPLPSANVTISLVIEKGTKIFLIKTVKNAKTGKTITLVPTLPLTIIKKICLATDVKLL